MDISLEMEIEQLIEKLQKEIKEEGYIFEEEPFFEEEIIEKNISDQNHVNKIFIPDSQLHYDRDLKASKKSLYRVIIFLKRMIRKCNRFLIVPILDEQSDFNYSVKTEIDRLNTIIELQEQRIKELEWIERNCSR